MARTQNTQPHSEGEQPKTPVPGFHPWRQLSSCVGQQTPLYTVPGLFEELGEMLNFQIPLSFDVILLLLSSL